MYNESVFVFKSAQHRQLIERQLQKLQTLGGHDLNSPEAGVFFDGLLALTPSALEALITGKFTLLPGDVKMNPEAQTEVIKEQAFLALTQEIYTYLSIPFTGLGIISKVGSLHEEEKATAANYKLLTQKLTQMNELAQNAIDHLIVTHQLIPKIKEVFVASQKKVSGTKDKNVAAYIEHYQSLLRQMQEIIDSIDEYIVPTLKTASEQLQMEDSFLGVIQGINDLNASLMKLAELLNAA